VPRGGFRSRPGVSLQAAHGGVSGAGQQRRGVGAGFGLVGELAMPELMERPAAELGELVLRRVRVGQAPGGLLEDLGRAAVGQAGAVGDRARSSAGPVATPRPGPVAGPLPRVPCRHRSRAP
jgi:hypothetical protein